MATGRLLRVIIRIYPPVMLQRSITHPEPANDAFAVQINLLVPEPGFGKVLLEMLRWLRGEVGENNFARRDASTFEREILAIHLRRPADAAAFLSSFPKIELDDGTTTPASTLPLLLSRRSGP